jgi:hypothetical protein
MSTLGKFRMARRPSTNWLRTSRTSHNESPFIPSTPDLATTDRYCAEPSKIGRESWRSPFKPTPFNYFSISETQFNRMESGAALASSTFVRIKNLCPSPLTSYEKRSIAETA